MGYLFVGLALLAGLIKGYCGKKTSGFTVGLADAGFVCLIRMLLCTAFGLLIVLFGGNGGELVPSANLILVSLLSGVASAFFVLTWLIEVKKSAYMLVDIFLMLGVLVTLVLSKIFFNESIKITQWLGIAVLFIAVLLMCSYNSGLKGKISLSSILILIFCGLSNGIADFSQKLFVKTLPDYSASVFNFYTYIFATVTLLIFYLAVKKKEKATAKSLPKNILIYISVMAVCLFLNSFFKTLAAEHLEAVLLYPLNQGSALALSAVMSAVVFKEKLNLKAIFGILTAFIGLLIINLL